MEQRGRFHAAIVAHIDIASNIVYKPYNRSGITAAPFLLLKNQFYRAI